MRLKDDRDPTVPLRIGLAVTGTGNRGLPGTRGADPRADHAVLLGPGRTATLLQAAWLDPLPWQYAGKGYVAWDPAAMRTGSGAWARVRQILNRPLVVPGIGRQAAEFADRSRLGWGTGDPAVAGFDTRNLVMARGKVVELRLPWGLLGYADPSSHQVVRGGPRGVLHAERAGRLGITVQLGNGAPVRTAGYAWEDWQRTAFHERPKAGWGEIAREFAVGAGAGMAR